MLSPQQLKTNIPKREMPAGTLVVSTDGQEIWRMNYTSYPLSWEPSQPHFGNTPDRRSKRPWEDGPGSCFCSHDVPAGNNMTGSLRPDRNRPAVTPTAAQSGVLIAQLSAIIFCVTRTEPSQSETVRWTTSWLNYLSHVTDPPSPWSIDTEELRP
jgi:hypothetical protein